jgi:hypothetical protein
VATSFKGWLNSWLDSWGAGTVDPNAVSGTTTITLSATGQIGAAGWVGGSATVALSITGEVSEQLGLSGVASITIGASGAISGVGNTPSWRVIWVGADARGNQISAEMRISYA